MEIFDNSVLIVDDEPNILNSFKITLKNMVSNIYTASSAEEALKVLKENEIHLAISDIMMGEMDGLDLLKKIKEDYPHIVCVMVTGYADKDKVKTALTLGAYDFLEKPCDIEVFKNCVIRCLDKVNFEIAQREMLEILLYHYSDIDPKNFEKLSQDKKREVLKGVMGLMKIRVLKEKGTKND